MLLVSCLNSVNLFDAHVKLVFICSVTFCTVSASGVVLSATLCMWSVTWPAAHAFCRYIFKCYSIKTVHRTSLDAEVFVFIVKHDTLLLFVIYLFYIRIFLIMSFYGDSYILYISPLWTSIGRMVSISISHVLSCPVVGMKAWVSFCSSSWATQAETDW